MNMRPLEFRVWFESKKKMIYLGSLGFTTSLECAHPTLLCDNNEHWWNPEDWDGQQPEIMQFTGLLDKNGTEIYEGDIVSEGEGCWYGKIVYCEELFTWLWLPLGKSTGSNSFHAAERGSIIGNIYENPDLLN